MIKLLLKLLRSKAVTIAYPAARDWPAVRGNRGTPVLLAERCDTSGACVESCPTGAIRTEVLEGASAWRLDYGLCIFCGACIRACSNGAIAASDSFELAVRERSDAVTGSDVEATVVRI